MRKKAKAARCFLEELKKSRHKLVLHAAKNNPDLNAASHYFAAKTDLMRALIKLTHSIKIKTNISDENAILASDGD